MFGVWAVRLFIIGVVTLVSYFFVFPAIRKKWPKIAKLLASLIFLAIFIGLSVYQFLTGENPEDIVANTVGELVCSITKNEMCQAAEWKYLECDYTWVYLTPEEVEAQLSKPDNYSYFYDPERYYTRQVYLRAKGDEFNFITWRNLERLDEYRAFCGMKSRTRCNLDDFLKAWSWEGSGCTQDVTDNCTISERNFSFDIKTPDNVSSEIIPLRLRVERQNVLINTRMLVNSVEIDFNDRSSCRLTSTISYDITEGL